MADDLTPGTGKAAPLGPPNEDEQAAPGRLRADIEHTRENLGETAPAPSASSSVLDAVPSVPDITPRRGIAAALVPAAALGGTALVLWLRFRRNARRRAGLRALRPLGKKAAARIKH